MSARTCVNGGSSKKRCWEPKSRRPARYAVLGTPIHGKEAEYDPQSAPFHHHVSAFNDYVRTTLKFGARSLRPCTKSATGGNSASAARRAQQSAGSVNVMPDLAVAMKQNPNLKVQLNGGYYDLATPYFAAEYELRQLPIEDTLRGNIEMHFYTSGHMVYAHEPDLKALHANVAAFIEKTKNGGAK